MLLSMKQTLPKIKYSPMVSCIDSINKDTNFEIDSDMIYARINQH